MSEMFHTLRSFLQHFSTLVLLRPAQAGMICRCSEVTILSVRGELVALW